MHSTPSTTSADRRSIPPSPNPWAGASWRIDKMTRASEREPRQSGRGDDIYPVQSATGQTASGSEQNDFYRRVLETLVAADTPFLVGGAYAFAHFTGIG